MSSSDAVLHGPVRFPAEWLDYCCTDRALEQRDTGAGEQSIRRCRRLTIDFSKAFDTVRHSSAMAKVAQLQLPDYD